MSDRSGLKNVLDTITSRPRIFAAGVVLLALAAYLPSLNGGFFSDDFVYVAGNPTLRSVPLERFWRLFASRANPYEFLPVRDLSYRLDLALFGLEPAGYHASNLVYYALSCLAAWLACRSLWPHFERAGPEGESRSASVGVWACVAVTTVFAVHPAHVEAVAWISGRKDVLSGLFALLSLWQFGLAIRPASPDWRRLGLSSALFGLAVMSKATVLPVVAVALLLALVRQRPAQRTTGGASPGRTATAVLPMAVVAAVWAAVALMVGRDTGIRLDPFLEEVTRANDPSMILRILGNLGGIGAAPVGLRLIYDIDRSGLVPRLTELAGLLVLGAGVAGAWFSWRRRSAVGFGAAVFLLLCSPYLQLVPFRTWSLVSDRFLFLPVFGLAFGAVALVARLGLPWLRGFTVGVAVLGVALTLQQSSKWASAELLVADTAERSPGSVKAQELLISQVLVPSHRYADAERAAGRVREAVGREVLLKYVRAHEAIESGNWELARAEARGLEYFVETRSGNFLLMLVGRLAEAGGDDVEAARRFYQAMNGSRNQFDLENARESLERVRSRHAARLGEMRARSDANPDDLVALGNLANMEMELFLLDEAAEKYRRILAGHPDLIPARYNLGLTLLRQGRHREAAIELRRAIDDGFSNPTAWNNLAIAYRKSGDVERAQSAYETALRLDPGHCDAAINLARLQLSLEEIDLAKEGLRSIRHGPCEDLGDLVDLYLAQADQMGDR